MGKRACRRNREHFRQAAQRQSAAAAVDVGLHGAAHASLDELRRLVGTRAVVADRIDDVIDMLVAEGVGWVPVARALGVSRQAARQTYIKRRLEHG